ncbi:MAG: thioredoxin family protein [Verrucomicrobia bacterium]|nr:thioredoxin family protein [Verrucomicrobiota bacterium]
MKLAWLLLAAFPPLVAQSASRIHPRLILSADTARPGETIYAGIELRLDPGWHTYWRNGGDSGGPPTIDWKLPKGVTAGEILWPPPIKHDDKGLITFNYEENTSLIVPLTVANDAPTGRLEINADLSWFECEQQTCVQGAGKVNASLNVGNESKPSPDAAKVDAWRKKLPRIDPSLVIRASWGTENTKDSRVLLIDWEPKEKISAPDFFHDAVENLEIAGTTEVVQNDAGKITLRKVIKKLEGEWPSQLRGILVGKSEASQSVIAYEAKLLLPSAPPGRTAAHATAIVKPALAPMLLFAFLGGLILNIMPCVLPVIALKILGFVNQAKQSPAEVRRLGLIYALGVLVSFLVLAGVVVGVKQAGQAASWGMQFQNSRFVVAMTALVTLVALNLFGVFEITLTGGAMGAASELAGKEGKAGAFFNGVLATMLATPCTAPFLGAALGFAFTQSTTIIVVIFLTVGLGLAAPYVMLCWQPAWLKFLPRPGAWMEKFKIAMGFPMLATAVWLYTLAVPTFGDGADFWFGLFLVVLALAAWVWGEFVQRGRKRKGLSLAIVIALLAVGYVYILEKQLRWRSPAPQSTSGSIRKSDPDGIDWQPWSPEAVAAARKLGRPILVDFTAKWCPTCQVNARTSLEIPSVRAKLKELNAVTLIENSWKKNSTVVAELNRYGRAGVPLVLVYPKDPQAEPFVLPSLLTPGIVLDYLAKAAK